MRRHDKKKHMERVNKLFEARNLKESAFSWDGKYENEEDLEEGMMSLGDDIENIEESGKTVAKQDIKKYLSDRPKEERPDWEDKHPDNYNSGILDTFNSDSSKKNKELSKKYPDLNPYMGNTNGKANEEVTNITTDVESSQFFSDENGEREMDGAPVG